MTVLEASYFNCYSSSVIKNELSNGDLQIFPTKGLLIVSHWNLVWLSSKKLSPTASTFLQIIEEKKQEVIENSFGWL